MTPSRWFAQYAALPTGLASDVLLEVEDGRFTAVTPGGAPGTATRLPGVVLPGFANAHSHAFHRALRGRTHAGKGSFWTWREAMYLAASRLDPDLYLDLARAAYAEMALAGFTAVGEFHYLHHAPGGRRYADPNVMAEALRQAAADAGVKLTLIDTCYLSGGLGATGHLPLTEGQRRFADRDVEAWADRTCSLAPSSGMRIGAGIHSVRAVPREDIACIVTAARGRPLHVHVSEQPAENAACLGYYGCSPTQLLAATGALGRRTTAVHATHLDGGDITLLGGSGTTVCVCPTTERDLADGLGPAYALHAAGCRLSLGSDQHAVTDPFEEARALEMHERVSSLERGRFEACVLLAALTQHESIGWPEAGRIALGARADLVAVAGDSVRTAGCLPEQLLFAATAADVRTVVVEGEVVVAEGVHRLGDVPGLLRRAIEALWQA